jgi:AmmeMemoRadiSam system protein B
MRRIYLFHRIALLLALILAACTGRVASPVPPTPTTPPGATATLPPPPLPSQEKATGGEVIGRVRPSVLAGTWYPADPDELGRMVDELLAAVEPVDGAPLALLVPHAGYAYSGPVAAAGFRQLQEGQYDVAVIIAADHQMPLSDPIAVWAEGGFQTPLGVVPVDVELARGLVAADSRIKADQAAHENEHPIEIELPFLQRVCPGCRIVPVLMGKDDDATVTSTPLSTRLALADVLTKVLAGRRAVVIASSDLSHYPAYQDALAVDGATLGAIETGEPAAVRAAIAASMARNVSNTSTPLSTSTSTPLSTGLATCACGEGPLLVAMHVAHGLGADTITVLQYANSGDLPYGDKDQVVGYGAVMFWRYRPPELTAGRQQTLLELARSAIAGQIRTGNVPDYQTEEPVLTRRSGAFVTLY